MCICEYRRKHSFCICIFTYRQSDKYSGYSPTQVWWYLEILYNGVLFNSPKNEMKLWPEIFHERVVDTTESYTLHWFSGTCHCHLLWTAEPSGALRNHSLVLVARLSRGSGIQSQLLCGHMPGNGNPRSWWFIRFGYANCSQSIFAVNELMNWIGNLGDATQLFGTMGCCHMSFLPCLHRAAYAAETNPREITCFTKWPQEASERGVLGWTDGWSAGWLIGLLIAWFVGQLARWLLWLLVNYSTKWSA